MLTVARATLRIESEPDLRSFTDMAQAAPGQTLALSRRFGAKAANLALLGIARCSAAPATPAVPVTRSATTWFPSA